MKRAQIDRSGWRCGGWNKDRHGKGSTLLRNEEGYMCCLGFRAVEAFVACGMEEQRALQMVEGKKEPYEFLETSVPISDRALMALDKVLVDVYSGDATEFAYRAMELNDADGLSRDEREEALVRLAAEYGEEWVFVGEYSDG